MLYNLSWQHWWRNTNKQDWKYTDISKVFFMPHHVGCCGTDVIRDQCFILDHACTDVIPDHHAGWVPPWNNDSWPCRLSTPIWTMTSQSCTLSSPVGTLTTGHAGWVPQDQWHPPRSCRLSTLIWTTTPGHADCVPLYEQWSPVMHTEYAHRNPVFPPPPQSHRLTPPWKTWRIDKQGWAHKVFSSLMPQHEEHLTNRITTLKLSG
jgi:hypothetical protein